MLNIVFNAAHYKFPTTFMRIMYICRKLFFLCAIPNILNGFHVASYVFLGKMPSSYWCELPELLYANWTQTQMRNISSTE